MYNYKEQRSELFTEEGVKSIIKVRDKVEHLLRTAGAFRGDTIGGSWDELLVLDYLVELGELVKLRDPETCWAQFQVYSTPQLHNL